MNNIENFCVELKNDIFSEIGENKDWDTADYTMSFFGGDGNGSTGLIILKRDNQEVKRIRQKKSTYFWDAINLLIDRSIVNKGTLTIYPSGEYTSAFIWDNVAHLDYLETMSKTWFRSFYEEAVYRVEDRVKKANIPWDFETEVVISFTDNLPNPVVFTTSDRLKMTFKLYLNQVWEYTKKTYASIFKSYDVANLERDNAYNIEQYKMMQSEELRVRFPRWNRATLWIDNILPHTDSSRFDPKSIKLEWIDENGVIVESATSTEWLKLDNLDHSKGF